MSTTRVPPVDGGPADAVDSIAERLVPEEVQGQIVHAEHLARYWWATSLVEGKRVLDAGCGTAYGTRILAEAGARAVIGVDVAADVLEAARADQPDSVTLEPADVRDLPYDDGSFDVVVCFEVIEHLADPDSALDEFARVLERDGVLCISSPNRRTYMAGNPHHHHEYVPEELEAALASRFTNVRLLRQDDWVGSAVLDGGSQNGDSERPIGEAEVRRLEAAEPSEELYTVALAGNGPLPESSPSVVLTHVLEIRRLAESWARVAEVEREVTADRAELKRIRAKGERQLAELEQRARESARALAKVEVLRAREAAELAETRRRHEEEVHELNETMRWMQQTRVWRLGSGWWRFRDRLLRRRN